MFKNFEEWLADQGITAEGYQSKETKEQASLYKQYMTYVSKQMQEAAGKGVSKEELEAEVSKQVEGFVSEESLKDIQAFKDMETRLEEVEEKAKQALEKTSAGERPNLMAESIKEQKDDLKAIAKGISGKEVVVKANTLVASIETNPSGYFLPNIGQLGVKRPGLYDVLPKITFPDGSNQGKIRYVDWDEDTTVRAAAIVAEGGTFPESTAKFKGYEKDLIKIGDTLPVSEEFMEDEVLAAAELEAFVQTNVSVKRDVELVNGPGTAGNIEGLLAAAPDYVPTNEGITAPNIYDLIRKVRTSITNDRGSKYNPDIVVMNDDVADRHFLTKDANENYIFRSESDISSMTIIIDNNMPANQLVVGDRRFARIYQKRGIVISRGLVNAQFVEDLETIKARLRILMLIREVDKTGFSHVTDIDVALTALAL